MSQSNTKASKRKLQASLEIVLCAHKDKDGAPCGQVARRRFVNEDGSEVPFCIDHHQAASNMELVRELMFSRVKETKLKQGPRSVSKI